MISATHYLCLGFHTTAYAYLRIMRQGKVLLAQLSILGYCVQRMLPNDERETKALTLDASALGAEFGVCLELVAAADAELLLRL